MAITYTMAKDNYYVINEQTGKLNVYTTKAYYDSLAPEQQDVFKRFCLWSRKLECWISKGKANKSVYLRARLKDLGFDKKGASGQQCSF